MLIAERVQNERLLQIIKELQRHRFGRRAETLPEDQLRLGLEEAEQIEAAGQAEEEKPAPQACADRLRLGQPPDGKDVPSTIAAHPAQMPQRAAPRSSQRSD
jgi:hypothetical protein